MSKKHAKTDVLSTPELSLRTFGFGDVLRIVGIEKWRLQNFLNGRRFHLSATGGQLGKGQGSRRMFRLEDLYRIGIADFLVRDGFAPNCVSSVLQWIEDQDLISFDEKGRADPPTIGFVREKDGPKLANVADSETILPSAQSGVVYYVLPLAQIVQGIDDRIEKMKGGT